MISMRTFLLLVLSTILMVIAVANVEEEDECLVYEEDDVHLLDSIQLRSDSDVEKLGSITDVLPARSDYTTQPLIPEKYDGFESLDQLFKNVKPVGLLDTLRAPESEPDIELFGPLPTTMRPKEIPQQQMIKKYDGFELLDQLQPIGRVQTLVPTTTMKYKDFEMFDSLYDVKPMESPAYVLTSPTTSFQRSITTHKPLMTTRKLVMTTRKPTITTYKSPSAITYTEQNSITRPSVTYSKSLYGAAPVQDHLEVSNKSTYILPWAKPPNNQDVIFDQFSDSDYFRGLYDVKPTESPAYVFTSPATTHKPTITTYKSPSAISYTKKNPITQLPVTYSKSSYGAAPVQDHLEVSDKSTYILPWAKPPNNQDVIFDQFSDSDYFRGLYDMKPASTTQASKSQKLRPFVPVVDEFVTNDVTYSYAPQTREPKPSAPVFDEFATNNVIYPRPKRATNDSEKPKRKCLKWKPKISINNAVTSVKTSTKEIKNNREVSMRCLGHRLGDLVSIGNCKKFYVRCDQEPKLMMCTRRGEVFSKTLYECASKPEVPECQSFIVAQPISATFPIVQKNGTMENFCQRRDDGFYRHFEDCARVIQCFDRDAFEYPPCPKKLVFDEKRGLCEYKRNVPGC